jgi:hypothetical protein
VRRKAAKGGPRSRFPPRSAPRNGASLANSARPAPKEALARHGRPEISHAGQDNQVTSCDFGGVRIDRRNQRRQVGGQLRDGEREFRLGLRFFFRHRFLRRENLSVTLGVVSSTRCGL